METNVFATLLKHARSELCARMLAPCARLFLRTCGRSPRKRGDQVQFLRTSTHVPLSLAARLSLRACGVAWAGKRAL
eukprot:9654034-Alexandrium_andersonii.AAC.1